MFSVLCNENLETHCQLLKLSLMRSTPFLISVMFLCLCIVCCSCVRENLETNEPSGPLYIGSWELRSTDGSMGHRDYPSGIGHTLFITKDSIIEKVNHERVYATTYQVI